MEQSIPQQLKGMRFNRVRFKEKRAFELGWQNKPYTYEQIQSYFPKENFGVICGKDIRVLDDDTPKKGLLTLFLQNFGETFRVRDHLYFKFDNKHEDKIIFNHPTLDFPTKDGKRTTHMGEIQGRNTYVVGPGCTHPSGEMYELKNDVPIITISWDKFIEVFGVFIKKDKPKIVRDHKPSDWKGDNITDIPLGNIISFDGLMDAGNECFQGSHPKHGSDNGMNFRVDTKNNTWTCFRCSNAWTRKKDDDSRGCGGPAELIAVMEEIAECDAVGSNCFTAEQGQEVIKVAREKYGLTIPEQDLGEVRGWANSVSIVNLAKKRNFEKCPTCETPWRFQDSHGLYYCDTCKKGGGLPQFADLIIERRNRESTAAEALSKL